MTGGMPPLQCVTTIPISKTIMMTKSYEHDLTIRLGPQTSDAEELFRDIEVCFDPQQVLTE